MIDVVDAGYSVVTDLGRSGLAHEGIQVNGAADRGSAIAANALVANPETAPLIEVMSFAAFSFRTRERMLIGVTGAAKALTLDGVAMPTHSPVVAWPGAVVRIAPARAGLRTYVGLHGIVEGDEFLGSRAFDPLIRRGRRLEDGDQVRVDHYQLRPGAQFSSFPICAPRPEFSRVREIGILPGPEKDEFGSQFTDGVNRALRVGVDSDHVGLRLEGHEFTRAGHGEVLSRGIPMGAVEVPPSGEPIVLLRGRPLTAGYPVPAVVGRGWHDELGQLRPGDEIVLRPTTVARSLARAQKLRDELERLKSRCFTALRASGLIARV